MELFQLLLKHGASPGYQDKDGRTALNIAVDKGDMEMVRLILEHAGDPNTTDNKLGWSALHCACEKRNTALVTMLLEHGADGDLKSNKGDTPLDIARAGKQLDVVRLLVLRLSGELHFGDEGAQLS